MTAAKLLFITVSFVILAFGYSDIVRSDEIDVPDIPDLPGAIILGEETIIDKNPISAGCVKGSKRMIRTLPNRYIVYRNGRKIVNSSKVGLFFSDRCKTIFPVVEGPVDTVFALENESGSIIPGSRGKTSKIGRFAGKMVKYSGKVRACAIIPFAEKTCTDFIAIP
jgi:hypothetical protein